MRKRTLRAFFLLGTTVLSGGASALLGNCGPFTDVAADVFCPFVLEIFYLGITTGTTATTYSPTDNVTRLQMAAFLSRTVDSTLRRGSRRAALDQFWTTQNATVVGLTTVGGDPALVASDGKDVWVGCDGNGEVSRVRASDGRLLETWTGAGFAHGVVVAMGRVFATGYTTPGALYRIDPSQPAGAVTTVASNLGSRPSTAAFDGARIWTANNLGASVSIVTPGAALPWTVTTVTTGFTSPEGILFDGSVIWVTDYQAARLFKLDAGGTILQTVTVGNLPAWPVFDGSNIWVPSGGNTSVAVVRASTGSVLATLTGNGLVDPFGTTFDGQRVLVTNLGNGTVSLWKAADLTPIGSFAVGDSSSAPAGAASDGINFWVALSGPAKLARF